MTELEPAADILWMKMESPTGSWLHPRWTVECQATGTSFRSPFDQPTFRFRRRAERYARKHTCEHFTYTVVPLDDCRCGQS